MINVLSAYKKLKKSCSKNLPELLAIKNGQYPEFVLDRNPKTLEDEIPVFTLHSVEANTFEEQLMFLSENNYQTLNADEFYECLIGSKPIPERAILLTFDDGWKNLKTVAYPLLKKYRQRAVCFLIPGLISEQEENGSESVKSEPSGIPDSDFLCGWQDVLEMHESGVIDFQSHSVSHHLIFVSSEIEDFVYPSFYTYAKNFNVPLYRINGRENVSRSTELGMPIYKYASRLSGKKRYFDDENLRNLCIEHVRANGGEEFFRNRDWRKKLMEIARDYRGKRGDSGHFESENEVAEKLRYELLESRLMIERKLPGKRVNHFCYPWWEGSDAGVDISREAGYLTSFWGIVPGCRTNRRGGDPFRIARLLSEDYIFRLPGEGRKPLLEVVGKRFSLNYRRLLNRLVQPD